MNRGTAFKPSVTAQHSCTQAHLHAGRGEGTPASSAAPDTRTRARWGSSPRPASWKAADLWKRSGSGPELSLWGSPPLCPPPSRGPAPGRGDCRATKMWVFSTHKNKLKMDQSSKCEIRNYKTPRGEQRQNTLGHKPQQDPL